MLIANDSAPTARAIYAKIRSVLYFTLPILVSF